MGQRLAIIFHDDSGKRFLTSYYHWSAYTSSMLEEVNRLVRKYTNLMNTIDNVSAKQNLLEAFYECGAGLERISDPVERNPEFKEALRQFYPDIEDANIQWGTYRNDGLVGITQRQMGSTIMMCDGRVNLMLHNDGTIDFISSDVYYKDSAKEYCEDFDIDFERFKGILLDASKTEGSLLEISNLDEREKLDRNLHDLDIDTYGGTAFFSKNGDFHLCLKTENGYVYSPLRYVGELSTYISFLDISDPEIFQHPEKAKIITAGE